MIKCCIFDLDGTLLNTLTTITYYINRTLVLHGLPVASEEEVCSYVGAGARNLVLRTLNARGITDEGYIEEFFNIYSAAYDDEPDYLTEPYSGIPELLSKLKAGGILVGVLSNKPDFATVSIVKKIFGGLVDIVHGGREGIALKPAPDAILALLSELGCERSECVYVGDSEIDVKTGINAELENSVAVTWGFRTKEALTNAGATKFADNTEELEKYIFG